MLLGVVLRLLLQVPEFAHAILPCLSGPASCLATLLRSYPFAGHRCVSACGQLSCAGVAFAPTAAGQTHGTAYA
jgi:hypothetical protein